ncbi:MAG: hypothetical protein EPO21_21860 [Chloroflexota bacterium]|nr:MAG: hypothetical protein EPO21_21860 [Chloroflexota bacterium]
MDGVILGRDVDTGQEVAFHHKDRLQGLYILGGTGMGKTTLIQQMILQDMQAGFGLCCIDPHGDLTRELLEQIPAHREKDVILLDPLDPDYAFGLNLYALDEPQNPLILEQTREQAMQIFLKIWGDPHSSGYSWGPLLEDLLSNCTASLIANPPYTMAEISMLLRRDTFRKRLVSNLPHGEVRDFWEQEYDEMREGEQREHYRSTMNKVRQFTGNSLIRHIVGQSRSTVHFREWMDSGKIVLITLSERFETVRRLVGTAVISQIYRAALSRGDIQAGERTPFMLYVDEYDLFATADFARILKGGRKFGIATTFAHQERTILDAANRGASLQGGNIVVFRITGQDAEEMAKQFDRTPPPPAIVGQRPKMIPTPDPLQQLLTAGHQNSTVRTFIDEFLRPLYEWQERRNWTMKPCVFPSDWNYLFQDKGKYKGSKIWLESSQRTLNTYLTDLMRGTIKPYSEEEAVRLADILISFRAHFGFHPQDVDHSDQDGHEWGYISTFLSEQGEPTLDVFLSPAVRDSVVSILNPSLAHDNFIAEREAFWRDHIITLAAERQARIAAITQCEEGKWSRVWTPKGMETAKSHYYNREKIDGLLRFRGRLIERIARAEELSRVLAAERSQYEYHQLQLWASCFLSVARELTQNPLLVASGEYEPIYDKPATTQEVENQIASNLVNLGKYHARCKIQQGRHSSEYTIHTPEYQGMVVTPEALARAEQIRARSRQQYYRLREDVEREIAERQRGDDPPPTTRRRAPL